jgi:cobalamin biosynthesis Mg chelatase CobN
MILLDANESFIGKRSQERRKARKQVRAERRAMKAEIRRLRREGKKAEAKALRKEMRKKLKGMRIEKGLGLLGMIRRPKPQQGTPASQEPQEQTPTETTPEAIEPTANIKVGGTGGKGITSGASSVSVSGGGGGSAGSQPDDEEGGENAGGQEKEPADKTQSAEGKKKIPKWVWIVLGAVVLLAIGFLIFKNRE